MATNVCPGAQMHIAADESGQFGDPQAGLHGHLEQGVITATGPGRSVGCGQQGIDLPAGQEAHQFVPVAFGGDGQHPLDRFGVFGMLQGGLSAVDDYPQWTGRRIRIPLQGRRLAL